jgi:hypothetical protein
MSAPISAPLSVLSTIRAAATVPILAHQRAHMPRERRDIGAVSQTGRNLGTTWRSLRRFEWPQLGRLEEAESLRRVL